MPYSIMVNLEGKRCVVVGAGKVAERRVEALRRQDAIIHLLAPQASPVLKQLADEKLLTWIQAPYASSYLDNAFLVVAATDVRDVNQAVARDAQARNLLVTCADEPSDGNYLTPSVIERGDLTIAVSTGGASPTLAAILRARLESEFGPEWAGWTRLFRRLRPCIQAIAGEAERKAFAQKLLNDATIQQLLREERIDQAETEAGRCI